MIFQSGCKAYHSTESALFKIKSDISDFWDENKVCILTLLLLSAASDKIDRLILVKKLKKIMAYRDWFAYFDVVVPPTSGSAPSSSTAYSTCDDLSAGCHVLQCGQNMTTCVFLFEIAVLSHTKPSQNVLICDSIFVANSRQAFEYPHL